MTRRLIGIPAAIILALASTSAVAAGPDEPGPRAEVTIEGNVLCGRATDPKPWAWDPRDGDHTPIIYAIQGTPEVDERLRRILETYPDRGLDVEDALRIQDEFGKHLKFAIAPGPIAAKIHKAVEAGSQMLALTGTVAEEGGQRWITVTRYEPSRVKYPEKMRAPDRPLAPTAGQPIALRIGDSMTLKCIRLPAGRFLQGSPFYQWRYQDEYPHEVVLTRPFAMAEIPVTQEMFEAVMGKNPSRSRGARLPVDSVPLADIREFCRRVSQQNGLAVRLPTDAEWEYAARVGTSNPCVPGKYDDQISETGGRLDTTPVRSKSPNAWGLYDMLCSGWHVTADYKSDNVRVKEVDPKGPAASDPRVHRDGGGRLHKTRGGRHYDHHRPSMHGAAADDGSIWEGGAAIFRVVVEPEMTKPADR